MADNNPSWRAEGVDGDKQQEGRRRPSWKRLIAIFLIAWVASYFLFSWIQQAVNPVVELPYNEYYSQVQNDNVETLASKGDTLEGELRQAITYEGVKSAQFVTERPTWAEDAMAETLSANDVTITAVSPVTKTNPIVTLIFSLLPIALLVGLWYWFFQRQMKGGAGGSLFGGKSHEPIDPEKNRVNFEDVAGIDEVEDQLREVVDMLKNPDRYTRLGAKIPRGILLEGGPGTGKTLLARATAGEASVPFFSVSAAEIGGILAGKGASDIRSLFEAARKVAPAIVFIDEIDAIGRSRASAQSIGSNEDREQTLNQILTEMDGFSASEGIIVLAATNLAEVLDTALTRAGRFDRTITVSAPDQKGREDILRVHTRERPIDPSVSLASIAKSTPGLTGADLANLVNEASLLAARRGNKTIQLSDFTDALETIQLGVERSVMMDPEELKRTAWHEAGHALLGMIQPGADPVRKISIIPRGRALGVTLSTPEADKYGYDKAYLRGRIIGALGGMAAEEVVFGVVTTGAESDLQAATNIARQMFGRWGMSETIGPVQVYPTEGDPRSQGVSDSLLSAVDSEVRALLADCYEDAKQLLREHSEQHKALVDALMEHETLDEEDAYRIAGIEHNTAAERHVVAGTIPPSPRMTDQDGDQDPGSREAGTTNGEETGATSDPDASTDPEPHPNTSGPTTE
ncbi:ATP-dependent zinc metalloprotease FtsH [Ancrocorticia populi]|uniref:ATP-dependent zinc metalloprotease FtsH n=1 Tax=Ancrocorticia populi TaxID=2175228 RepID=A0A2V1K5Z8_9ACTO|nr:ATP-dependent zinc metalloprotease FtsH [Ancrocorticia populi]PWF26745.1 cell division protein FtsH [Ancrocorticia populi]